VGALVVTGVPAIDREHAALFVQLDRLLRDSGSHPSSELFSEVLGQIGTSISAHFRNEEGYLQSCGMPAADVAAHIKAHTLILEQYAQLNCDLMDGRAPGRTETIAMIRNWVVGHMRQFDTLIRDYPAPLGRPN